MYRYPGKPPTRATDNDFEDKVSRSEGTFLLLPCRSVFLLFLKLDEVCSFFPEKRERDDCNKLIDFCDIQLVPVQNGSHWYSLSTPELLLGAKGRSLKDKYSVLPCI